MMSRTMALLLALALASPALLAADADWQQAVIEMSDGTTLAGKIMLVNDQLILHNEAEKRKYTLRLADMKQIESVVENEAMEKKWFFKESGRDEKVYTGDTYPVRQFTTRVTFQDGRTLEGHIIGTSGWLKSGEGEASRFQLVRQMEGEVGQKLDDLVYVKKVTLNAGGGVLGSISGTVRVPAGEKLEALMAINCRDEFCIAASLTPGGRFSFSDCTAGAYDLVAVSDKAVYLGLSGGRAEAKSAVPELAAGTLADIGGWANKVRDFFDAHDALYGVGDKERAYVLVRMERPRDRPNTLRKDTGFRRYEVWLIEKPADEWQIVKRFFISRSVGTGTDMPRERLAIRPEMGGNQVSAATPNLTLALDLASPPGQGRAGGAADRKGTE